MKKSLINAIKKLLTKLGAQEVEGNNLVEVINNGADVIEGGGGSGGAFIVHGDTSGETPLDKTFAEIKTAMKTNVVVFIRPNDGTPYYLLNVVSDFTGERFVTFKSFDETIAALTFKTTEDDGYPVFKG